MYVCIYVRVCVSVRARVCVCVRAFTYITFAWQNRTYDDSCNIYA